MKYRVKLINYPDGRIEAYPQKSGWLWGWNDIVKKDYDDACWDLSPVVHTTTIFFKGEDAYEKAIQYLRQMIKSKEKPTITYYELK